MFKKTGYVSLIFVILASSVAAEQQSARSGTLPILPTLPEKVFVAYSSLQSDQLAVKKIVPLLGVPLALYVLEHRAGIPSDIARLKGKDVFKALGCALAHHIIPLAQDKKIAVALKKGLKNFVLSGQSIRFLFDAAMRFNAPSGMAKRNPSLYLAQYAVKILLIAVNLTASHRQTSSLLNRVNKEARRRRVKGVEWSVGEPSKKHVMLLNPWVKTLQNLVSNRGLDGLRFNARYGILSKRSISIKANPNQKAFQAFVDTLPFKTMDERNTSLCLERAQSLIKNLPVGIDKDRQKTRVDQFLSLLDVTLGKNVLQVEPVFALFKLLLEKLFFKRAYISPQTMAKLSPKLRQEILDLNEQERVVAALNLTDFNANLLWLALY